MKLKRCPFCGVEAEIFTAAELKFAIADASREYFTIRCRSCFCGTGWYPSIDRAVETWNRREGEQK